MKFKKTGGLVLTVLMVATCVLGQDTASSPKKQPVSQKAEAQPSVQEQIQALREALDAQSKRINSLEQALADKDSRLKKAEQQAAEAQAAADKAGTVAATEHQAAADNAAAVSALQTSVNTVKANTATLTRTLNNETAQLRKERANPTSLYYKGISLTIGGFIAADTVYRSKGIGSDIPTSFNNLPYQGDNRYKLSEVYGSARPTRISLLFESKPKWGALRGYYEADFQGAGTNSNNNQMNSYMMRQRVLYGEAEMNSGWKLAFGQMWSLATEGNKGIPSNPNGILTPLTIDTNYMPGFIWARQYGVRVVKSFANGKFTVGASVENPQLIYSASLAGNTPYTVLGSSGSTSGYNAAISSSTATTYIKNYVGAATNVASAGYVPVYATVNANTNIANYSFNQAPDVIVKAVADPGWGHYEVFGLVGFAHGTIYPGVTTDRVKYGGVYDINCPDSDSTCSPIASFIDPTKTVPTSIVLGGVGGALRIPVIKHKLDFGVKALYGPGAGRYGGSTLTDVTSRADGSLAPIHNFSGLLTLEYTATKRLTLWANYGGDYAGRADYSSSTTTGLGTPTACFLPNGASTNVAGGSCILAKNVTAAQLASGGTWGASWITNSGLATIQPVGYGSRQAINYTPASNVIPYATGCNVTAAPGYNGSSTGYNASTPASCVGQTRSVQEITGGYYYDLYKGEYGRLRQGIQYGYAVRQGWSGVSGYGAKGIDNMFWTSLRYYLP